MEIMVLGIQMVVEGEERSDFSTDECGHVHHHDVWVWGDSEGIEVVLAVPC